MPSSTITTLVPLVSTSRPRATVYRVPERILPSQPACVESEDYENYAKDRVPIVIDNGSSSFRGDSIVSKYRDRKTNRPVLLAGSDSWVDATSRSNSKPIFEEGVVCNFDCMEGMLDYLFWKLGVEGENVEHPIVMSETLCNPLYNRGLMSEIMFESYRVPSLCYGVDSLFSFYSAEASPGPSSSGLVISAGHASTSIIPVLDGKGRVSSARRLNWGGAQAADYMLKLMQLKYPAFPSRMTTFQASELVKNHVQFSADYQEDVRKFKDPEAMVAIDRVIQFPFTPLEVNEKTEEELAVQAERKRLAGIRLQEQTSKMRLDKLLQKESDLQEYVDLQSWKSQESASRYAARLSGVGFESEAEFEALVKKTQRQLQKARNKDLGIDEEESKEEPNFTLIDVPDHQLDEDSLKEKRRQRLMKAGYDARERAKAERDAEKLRLEAERLQDQEARRSNPEKWLAGLRSQHEDVINRIKDRKKRKIQLSDRKSLAAQQRMKTIATLASDTATKGKKRKKGNDDTFGADDADWAVYRDVAGADESADEEDEQAELNAVEARLLEFDPSFTVEDTHERSTLRKHALLNSYLRGIGPNDSFSGFDAEDLEQNSQLHLNLERIRVAEPLYQPLMAGVDQAGIIEVIQYVLREFSSEEQKRLTNNVFVTGGHSLLPNFDLRLGASLRAILPVESPLTLRRATGDPFTAAWRGMSKWALTEEHGRAAVTRAEYDECGGEYIKEHAWGNAFVGRF